VFSDPVCIVNVVKCWLERYALPVFAKGRNIVVWEKVEPRFRNSTDYVNPAKRNRRIANIAKRGFCQEITVGAKIAGIALRLGLEEVDYNLPASERH
jgi:hypothetical protein